MKKAETKLIKTTQKVIIPYEVSLTNIELNIVLDALIKGHEFADSRSDTCTLCGEGFNCHHNWCDIKKAIDIIKQKLKD